MRVFFFLFAKNKSRIFDFSKSIKQSMASSPIIEQLYQAIRDKNASQALQILKDNPTGLDINWQNENADNRTCLYLACARGLASVVERLLNYPARINVNLRERGGYTPFCSACDKNRVEVVKLLLNDHRTDINQETLNNWTPIMIAPFKGKIESIEAILASMRTITRVEDAIEKVKFNNKTETVKLLSDYQANPIETVKTLRQKLDIKGKHFSFSIFTIL